jgi:hypothetical protein
MMVKRSAPQNITLSDEEACRLLLVELHGEERANELVPTLCTQIKDFEGAVPLNTTMWAKFSRALEEIARDQRGTDQENASQAAASYLHAIVREASFRRLPSASSPALKHIMTADAQYLAQTNGIASSASKRSRKPSKALYACVIILSTSALGLAWHQTNGLTNQTASASIARMVSGGQSALTTRIEGWRAYASREYHSAQDAAVGKGQHPTPMTTDFSESRTERKVCAATRNEIAESKFGSVCGVLGSQFGVGGTGTLPIWL